MADSAQVFHVPPENAEITVSSLLKGQLTDRSWSQVRKLIHSRHVMVNGNLCLDQGRRLSAGDVVKVTAQPLAAPPKDDDVRIRHLDAHVVVVEKPAGMTTMRHNEELSWPERRKQMQGTLDEVLPRIIHRKLGKSKDRSTKNTSSPAAPSGKKASRFPSVRAVHRLDRETSGLMVFARTPAAERHLVQQFRAHTVHRRYIAIVQGRVEPQTIATRLIRDRGDGRRGSTADEKAGQRAVTHVRPLEYLHGYTVIECRLETGRTHQIRIHLAERGHPVCGEKIYNQPLFGKPISDASGAARQALHAAELGFVHPATGEELAFKMPLPDDMKQLLTKLRKQ